jgi:N-acetylglutamate synthase-like GNAT family acetyltransferase
MTTTGTVEIRRATLTDADGISRTVIRTLRETNAQDYAPEIIDAVVFNFTPERVTSLIENRQVYVAMVCGKIVGTASLQGSVVRTVFIDPDHQGKGIGSRLMDTIESVAQAKSISSLSVPSSLTAEGFYKKLGYNPVREVLYGNERTIVMMKQLPPRAVR